MKTPLKLLLVEDNPDDAELLLRELRRSGYDPTARRVDTEAAFLAELSSDLDLILSDYQMPQFTGIRALELMKARDLDLPFIIVSGTIGEETAVEAMRLGAMDYLLKDRLGRLGNAVERALNDFRLRREHRQMQEDFQLLFRCNPMPMWVYELKTLKFLAINDAAVAHYGYSREEFLSFTLKDIRPAEDVDALVARQARIHEGIERAGIWRHRRKDGSNIMVEITSHPLSFGGRAAELVLAHDVTLRLEAEAALRESEARFRQVVENIREVFWLSDVAKSRIIYVSPGYEQIWGRKCEELYASAEAWLQSIDSRDREHVHQAAMHKQVSGEYDETYRIVRPSGEVRWVRDRAYPVKEADGQVHRVVGVAEDITERKQLEEQFFRAQRMEAIGTLAGGIAHDLNNILAPVMMIVGLLKERLTSPGDAKSLQMVEANTQRGAAIIRQLLMFSRGKANERVSVQMRHLLREVADLMRETLPREITVRVEAPANLWTVMGDATQLHQVLMNLCVNARDAMPAGGTLLIKGANIELNAAEARRRPPAQPGNYAVITVADTGEGIPPEIIERIFDPFFTTKGIGKGTGLGLCTVLGIAKAHGGFVTVESEPKRGTSFAVYLPTDVPEVEPGSASAADAVAVGKGELVLVVDDEPDLRATLVLMLERYGYRVVSAGNGKQALAVFGQHQEQLQLVLTDVMMPEMSGIALIRAIRATHPGLRIVAMTGLGEDATTANLAAEGVSDIVQKPCTPYDLLAVVRQCLDRP